MPQDARIASNETPIRSRWRDLLLGRTAGILAAAISIVIILGCMSIGETRTEVIRTEPAEPESPRVLPPGDGLLEQRGRVTVPGNATEDVYYPIPYVSPPNVAISPVIGDHVCTLVSQRTDHFRVHNTWSGACTIEWQANGIKMLLAPLPPQPSAPPPSLPALPVPLENQPKP